MEPSFAILPISAPVPFLRNELPGGSELPGCAHSVPLPARVHVAEILKT